MGPELRELLIFSMFSTIAILLIVKSTSDGLMLLTDGKKKGRKGKKETNLE